MSNKTNLQRILYFIQAIHDRNNYYVEDQRYGALEALREVTFTVNNLYIRENYLKLYKVLAEEKPEGMLQRNDQAKPTPIWSVTPHNETLLRRLTNEINHLLELEN